MKRLLLLLIAAPCFAQMNMSILGGNSATATPSIPFVTMVTPGTVNSAYTGCLGFSFTVGAANIVITDLGRWVLSGNSASHTVVIQKNADMTVVASATLNTSGATPGQYLYASITPVTLTSGVSYTIASSEISEGDSWYADGDTVISTTGAGTIYQSSYQSGGCPASSFSGGAPGVASNVPMGFKYHL